MRCTPDGPNFTTVYFPSGGYANPAFIAYGGYKEFKTPTAAALDYFNFLQKNSFGVFFTQHTEPPLVPVAINVSSSAEPRFSEVEIAKQVALGYLPFQYYVFNYDLYYLPDEKNVEGRIRGGGFIVDESCAVTDGPAPPEPPLSPPLGCASGTGGFFACPGNSPQTNTTDGAPQNNGASDPTDASSFDPNGPGSVDDSAGGNGGGGDTTTSVSSNSCKRADAVGDPIMAGTGNVYAAERDYSSPIGLNFVRSYNSSLPGWVHNFQLRIIATSAQADVVRPDGKIYTFIDAGAGAWVTNKTVVEQLTKLNPANANDPSWKFVTAQGTVELYDANGMPKSITWRGGRGMTFTANGKLLLTAIDNHGRSIKFAYDGQSRLTAVTTPDALQINYSYDSQGRLAQVTYPDNFTRKYVYENTALPLLLTGIVDENGNRFASWTYDSQGRATSGTQAGGANSVQLTYDANLATQVTDAIGAQRILQFTNVAGRKVFTGQNQPCAQCYGDAASKTIDPVSSMVTQSTDYLGINQLFTIDSTRRLVLSNTQAANRPEAQTTRIDWHPLYRLPVLVSQAGRTTAYTYDNANGNLTGMTVTDTVLSQIRAWGWTYTPVGLISSATDPLGRVTAYSYDMSGNNTRIVNALAQATNMAYDSAGRMTQLRDANARVFDFTYDARGRMTSRSLKPAGAGAVEVDQFTYSPSGQLQQTRLANGLVMNYSYDAAQRLTGMSDSFGTVVAYTLDGMGNRTSTIVKDALSNVALQRGAIINSLNRIAAMTGAQGQTTSIGYDANGQVISQTDANRSITGQSLDGLRRPIAQTFADNAVAQLGYNGLDQLTALKDPKGVQTGYSINAFGNVLIETSPDVGTSRNSYDAAGNLSQRTDARGLASSYTYDALNRVTQISSTSFSTATAAVAPMVTKFNYDSATNGIGRLAQIVDGSGNTAYVFDGYGRIASKSQSLLNGQNHALRYTYAPGGQIASITYPSGRIVSYLSNGGRVTSIMLAASVKDIAKPFVNAITYTALNQVKSWLWASGDSANRAFDSDGRMSANEFASYSYDPASRITAITQNLYAPSSLGLDSKGRPVISTSPYAVSPVSYQIGYDSRDRVVSFSRKNANSSADAVANNSTNNAHASYSYDANSNRTSSAQTGAQIGSGSKDSYERNNNNNGSTTSQRQWSIEPSSNRLIGFSQQIVTTDERGKTKTSSISRVNYALDAAGNQTSDGLSRYDIDAQGRIASLTQGHDDDKQTSVYRHNGLGQRVFKSQPINTDYEPSDKESGAAYVAWLKSKFGWMFNNANSAANKAKLGTAYAYDEAGNLMGEYGNGGASSNGTIEYIWLPTPGGGTELVGAVLNTNGISNTYAVHTDHLGTPRRITDRFNKPVWQWAYSAFGDNAPTTVQNYFKVTSNDEAGDDDKNNGTALTFNLRFPGQYFDKESGLNYNYFRSYDSKTGRYTQADPIGLGGGLNRFGYVEGNPLSKTDPTGLLATPANDTGSMSPRAEQPELCAANDRVSAQNKCQAQCSFELDIPGRRDNFGPYRACLRRCLARYGFAI